MTNSLVWPTASGGAGLSNSSSKNGDAASYFAVYTSALHPPDVYGTPATLGASSRRERFVPTSTSVPASNPTLWLPAVSGPKEINPFVWA